MIDAAKIAELSNAKLGLSLSDQEFASSLIAGFKKHGGLTPKQEPWVQKLIDRVTQPKEAPKPTAKLRDMAGVIGLFEKAAQKLKYPAIVLALGSQEVRITRASAESKNPGWVYVKLDGKYLGKISPIGDALYIDNKEVLDLLEALAADPAAVATAHGKLTGKCCFCNSKLTDQKSTDVGYGPVCAKHYDLPWGANWSQHAAAVGPAILMGDGQKMVDAEIEACGLDDIEETVASFEDEQRAQKLAMFVPVPGRACKDLLEMMNA
jgi:hypothetical protein